MHSSRSQNELFVRCCNCVCMIVEAFPSVLTLPTLYAGHLLRVDISLSTIAIAVEKSADLSRTLFLIHRLTGEAAQFSNHFSYSN